jgi:hypothetical protein
VGVLAASSVDVAKELQDRRESISRGSLTDVVSVRILNLLGYANL